MADVTITDVMKAYAQDAEGLALKEGISLDYTEKIEGVDALLRQIAGDSVVPPNTPAEEEQLWMLAKVYGGYLGEVVIRTLGGDWEMNDNPD